MTFPILGGNGAVADAYSIDNSLRFNDGDSAYLTRTNSSGGDRQKFTTSFWIKRGNLTGSGIKLFDAGASTSSDSGRFFIGTFGTEKLVVTGGATTYRVTSQVFRDVSAWYHIIVAVDSTQGTSDNRVKIYVNGNQVTNFDTNNSMTQNQNTPVNENTKKHEIGRNQQNGTEHYDGYMAEWNFIDGQQLSPTDFGEYDEDSGIWKPKEYEGSYGTNGFYLDFENSGSLGADSSGNGNNFTPTNLASTDQTTDTPTNNFATLNANDVSGGALSQGNLLQISSGASNTNGTIGMPTGKWYWEIYINVGGGGLLGIGTGSAEVGTALADLSNIYGYALNGDKYQNTTGSSYGASYGTGDLIGVKFDADTRQLEFLKNNSSQGVAFTVSSGDVYLPQIHSNGTNFTMNFGQDSSFAGQETRQNNSDGNGYGDFYYAPPSGYLALCTQNLATELSPTIDDGSSYFNSVLYTGDGNSGGARNITGVGFQPDWTWIKERNSTTYHNLFDSNRGAGYVLHSNVADAEGNYTSYFTSFDSDGFTLENNAGSLNGNGDTYVAWNWLASGSTASNTDGSITSTVSANTTAGFSIVTYTGNGGGQTIGHGLSQAPVLSIRKKRNTTGDWFVHTNIFDGGMDYLKLNTTDAKSSSSLANFTATTSGADDNSDQYVVYFFHSVEGYSKIGTYTGNGSTDGTFVYTGFRPAFIITKKTDGASNWGMLDATRSSFNLADDWLGANLSNAESVETTRSADLLSNGFKARGTNGDINHDSPYIYMAFAENPFVSSSGVPVTAR